MRKIYALIFSILLIGNLSAQQVQDGGFEGMVLNGLDLGIGSSNINTFVDMGLLQIDWIGVVQPETTNPITGGKSALMVGIEDSVAASLLQLPHNQVCGFVQQVYEEPVNIAYPSTMELSFDYKFTPVGTDTGFALLQVIDTNFVGNEVLWVGIALLTTTNGVQQGSITDWLHVDSLNQGTANQIAILFGTSVATILDDEPAGIGSELLLDNVLLSYDNTDPGDDVDPADPDDNTDPNVSLEENTILFEVYPNPANDNITFRVGGIEKGQISILSITGQEVINIDINQSVENVNVSKLNTGVYLYRISDSHGNVLKLDKLIIQR